MDPRPTGGLASVSLDCREPGALADCYAAVLGLTRGYEAPEGGVASLAGAGMEAQLSSWRVLLDPAGHPFCLTTVTG